MPERINSPVWEQLAHALFGIAGENPIPGLEGAVRAVVPLRSDRFEWGFPSGEMHCHGRAIQTGVAAERAWVALRNEPNSGLLVVVESFAIDAGTNTEHTVQVSPQGTALPVIEGGSSQGFARDTRWALPAGVGGLASSRVHFGSKAGVTPSFNTGWSFNPNTGTGGSIYGANIGRLAVLAPDSYFLIVNEGLASSLRVGFLWRELPLHKGLRA